MLQQSKSVIGYPARGVEFAAALKTIALENSAEVRMFAFVLAFRTLLKRVFEWEERTVLRASCGWRETA